MPVIGKPKLFTYISLIFVDIFSLDYNRIENVIFDGIQTEHLNQDVSVFVKQKKIIQWTHEWIENFLQFVLLDDCCLFNVSQRCDW